MNYWLMKTEPSTFGVDDLAEEAEEDRHVGRRAQLPGAQHAARRLQEGRSQAFLYHSSCDVTGVAGIVEVVRTAYPDPTALRQEA